MASNPPQDMPPHHPNDDKVYAEDYLSGPLPNFPSSFSKPNPNSKNLNTATTTTLIPTSPTPTLTLPIKYTNIIGNRIHILHSPTSTSPLYTAHVKMTKPHITLSSPSSGKIGTINYHLLSCRIDVTMNSTPLPITYKTKNIVKCRHEFVSHALGGRNVVWRFRKGISSDLECVAEGNDAGREGKGSSGEVLLARFHFGGFYWMKKGRLEIFATEVADGTGVTADGIEVANGNGEGSVVEGGRGRELVEELVGTCVGLVNFYVFWTYTAIY